VIAEQLIRPTFIVDPEVELRATKNQIDDLLNEVKRARRWASASWSRR
jgi:excinuclease ABC subunit B